MKEQELYSKILEVLQELQELKEQLNLNESGKLSAKWLDIQEACFELKISKRTLQYYRNERILGFSQIAGKIYFKRSDIEEFLEKNYRRPRE